jgi:hypothetical protein
VVSTKSIENLSQIMTYFNSNNYPEECSVKYEEYIKAKRNDINQRVKLASKRYYDLQFNVVKIGFKTCFFHFFCINQISKQLDQKTFDNFFDQLLDLFLLAVGKKFYTGTDQAVRKTHMDKFFNHIVPIESIFLAKKHSLYFIYLFNLLENLQEKSTQFLNWFEKILSNCTEKSFKNISFLLIWLLGDPRYREAAIEYVSKENPNTIAEILGKIYEMKINSDDITNIFTKISANRWLSPLYLIQKTSQEITNNFLFQYGKFIGFPDGNLEYPVDLIDANDNILKFSSNSGKYFQLTLDGLGGYMSSTKYPTPDTSLTFKYINNTAIFAINSKFRMVNLLNNKIVKIRGLPECKTIVSNNTNIYIVGSPIKSKNKTLVVKMVRLKANWQSNFNYSEKISKAKQKLNEEKISKVEMITCPIFPLQFIVDNEDNFYIVGKFPRRTSKDSDDNNAFEFRLYKMKWEEMAKLSTIEDIERNNALLIADSQFLIGLGKDKNAVILEDGKIFLTEKNFENRLVNHQIPELKMVKTMVLGANAIYFSLKYSFHIYILQFDTLLNPELKNYEIVKL